MNYWLYTIICWVTHPFRYLMPFWKLDYGNGSKNIANLNFGLWLLFRNQWKVNLLIAQSAFETGMFSNKWSTEYNNYFSMGYVASNGEYARQSDKVAFGIPGEPTNMATYKSVYQSVYDMYLYLNKRTINPLKRLNEIPKGDFEAQSLGAQTYVYDYCSALKDSSYYTATLTNYYNGVKSIFFNTKSNLWRIGVNLVYCFLVPSFIVILYRRFVSH